VSARGCGCEAELVDGHAVEVAQEFAVAGADALRAAFPFGDHVGVDAYVLAVVHPGEARQPLGYFLLGPAAVAAKLAQAEVSDAAGHSCVRPSRRSARPR
jgi:hypothetical protein